MTEEKNKNSSIEMNINKNDIAIHTMQDDLDLLSGKAVKEKENVPDKNRSGNVTEKKSLFGIGKRKEEKKQIKTNPFLGNASPQKRTAPENKPEEPIGEMPVNIDSKPKIDSRPKSAFPLPTMPAKQTVLPPKNKIQDLKRKEGKAPKSVIPAKKPQWSKVLISVMAIVLIIAIAGGGYYFWSTKTADPVPQPQPEPIVEQPVIEVPQTKFSEDKPNYLNIDVETDTLKSITQLLNETSAEVIASGSDEPIEFLIRDSNNNPIAFSVFAYLMEISSLADEILGNLEESFSVYLYNDGGKARLGLAIDLKDKEMVVKAFGDEEEQLVDKFSSLFLGSSPQKVEIPFSDGNYEEFSIRYVNYINLDDENNPTSFDYTFTDKQVVIGTSKDSIRMILDRITADNNFADNDNKDGANEENMIENLGSSDSLNSEDTVNNNPETAE